MRVPCLVVCALFLAACGSVDPARGTCSVDGECPLHQLCEASSAGCVSGCLGPSDCSDGVCGDHGRCAAGGSEDSGLPLDGGVDLGERDLAGQAPADLTVGAADLRAFADAGACSGVCPDFLNEPNDTVARATPIPASGTLAKLALCPAGDIDWYQITAAESGSLVAFGVVTRHQRTQGQRILEAETAQFARC